VVAVSGGGALLFYGINDQPLGNSSTSNVLGNGSVWLSNVGGYLPLAWPAGFLFGGLFCKKGSSERVKTFSVAEQLVESIGFTYGFTAAFKIIFNRNRPDGSKYSFPSGHTAPNFAAAGILAYRYPWYIGVPALAAVSAIGFSRVDLNQHWASDVVAGAGLGLFFATSTYLNHRDTGSIKGAPTLSMFSPLMMGNTYGMLWTGRM
jgi:membrane-associated phospholipid phosphatase